MKTIGKSRWKRQKNDQKLRDNIGKWEKIDQKSFEKHGKLNENCIKSDENLLKIDYKSWKNYEKYAKLT